MVKNVKDIDQRYDYIKDYIREAVVDRDSLKAIIQRVIRAYKKIPARNTYKENANKFYKTFSSDASNDRITCKYIQSSCNSIPEATNDTIFNAIETNVSMTMGGIGQFEYKPADEYLSKDPELADMQSAFLKYMYEKNHIEDLTSTTMRKMVMQGQVNAVIRPTDNAGDFKISLVDAYKMIEDPRASKNNRPRYIGFQEISSWSDVKNSISVFQGEDGYMVKVVNDVDMYMQQLRDFGDGGQGGRWDSEITEDLNTFSSMYRTAWTKSSKSINKDNTKVENPATAPGYKGDDVEVTYIWDLISDIYFVVINRRFIVYMKKNPLQRKIKINIPYRDPQTGELTAKKMDYTVKVDSPIVHKGYIDADWETYPISPVFYCLNDFDNICSKESVLEHNMSIMAPITFLAAASDAEKVSGLTQIAGQIVEGTMNTFQVLNKSYDLSPITAAIERSETRIKRMMGATDQFELMSLLNNRATGAEVSMANGAVSQRMNIILSRMEGFYSELMSKLLTLQLIYTDDDTVFTFPYKDGVMALDQSDLVGNSLIRVKLASRIKIEMQQESQNALQLLNVLAPLQQQGVNIKRVIGTLVPIVSEGVVDRRTAESFIDDSLKIDPAQLNAAINNAEKERRAKVGDGPLTPDDVANLTPENMDELEAMMGNSMNGAPTNDDTQYQDNMGESFDGQEPSIDQMIAEDQSLSAPMDDQDMESDDMTTGQDMPAYAGDAGSLPTGADGMTTMPQGLGPNQAGQVANTNQDLAAVEQRNALK